MKKEIKNTLNNTKETIDKGIKAGKKEIKKVSGNIRNKIEENKKAKEEAKRIEEEKRLKEIEDENNRLLSLSEKELLIEMIWELRYLNDNMESFKSILNNIESDTDSIQWKVNNIH